MDQENAQCKLSHRRRLSSFLLDKYHWNSGSEYRASGTFDRAAASMIDDSKSEFGFEIVTF